MLTPDELRAELIRLAPWVHRVQLTEEVSTADVADAPIRATLGRSRSKTSNNTSELCSRVCIRMACKDGRSSTVAATAVASSLSQRNVGPASVTASTPANTGSRRHASSKTTPPSATPTA